MRAFKHPERLKVSLLRGVVQTNVDEIEDRLPHSLRPARRILGKWMRRVWMVAVPMCAVIAAFGVARWPVTAQASAVRDRGEGPREPAVRVRNVESAREQGTDPSLLSQKVMPDVLALSVRRVIVDAGHGGDHSGMASTNGVLEKDLTLDIATRVARLIARSGLDVVMTRSGDSTLSLMERAALANTERGDIFVSIHLNSLRPASARGIETYYLGPSEGPEPDALSAAENQHSGYSLADLRPLLERIYTDARRNESKRLAQSVQRALVRTLRRTDPWLADRGVKTAPFVVLIATEMPAVLAEVSCLSNAEEAARLGLSAYRETIAEALVAGIQHFAGRTPGTTVERTTNSGS